MRTLYEPRLRKTRVFDVGSLICWSSISNPPCLIKRSASVLEATNCKPAMTLDHFSDVIDRPVMHLPHNVGRFAPPQVSRLLPLSNEVQSSVRGLDGRGRHAGNFPRLCGRLPRLGRRDYFFAEFHFCVHGCNLPPATSLFSSAISFSVRSVTQFVVAPHQLIGDGHHFAEHFLRRFGDPDVVAEALGHFARAIQAQQGSAWSCRLAIPGHIRAEFHGPSAN